MDLKNQTIKLRQRGYSYNEINKKLGVSKSTLSLWLKGVQLSEKSKKRLLDRVRLGVVRGLVKRNKHQTVLAKSRAKLIRKEATREIKKISSKDLLLSGVLLYWAEGYKRLKVIDNKERTHHPISLTNSDPAMIKVFIKFLKEIMGIHNEKIRINLRLFAHMETKKTIQYWSKTLHISEKQFDKPVFVISKSSKGLRPFNRLPFGIAQVRVSNTNEFHRLMGWIDGVKKQLAHYSKKG